MKNVTSFIISSSESSSSCMRLTLEHVGVASVRKM